MNVAEFSPKQIDFNTVLEKIKNKERVSKYRVKQIEGESEQAFTINRTLISSEVLKGAAAVAMLVSADKCMSYLVLYKESGKAKVISNKGTSAMINGDITRSGLCNSLISLADNTPANFEIHVVACNKIQNLVLSNIDLDFQNKLIRENMSNIIKPYSVFDRDCSSCKESGTWCGCWTGVCY